MDAISRLIHSELVRAGVPEESIHKRTCVELPGYYRPEKQWDLVVVRNSMLICAIELKSQAGPSFGNNFNNRVEEVVGSAGDLWTAFREGRLGETRAPWLGYFFLLEDCPESGSSVAVKEPHFCVDPVFVRASYQKRYEVLCTRLVLERMYTAACLVTSTRDADAPVVIQPNANLSFSSFMASLVGHVKGFMGV